MAKEQVHGYIKTLLIIAAIVFAGGGYVMKIRGNSEDIKSNKVDIKTTNVKVHEIELNAKDTQALAAKAAEAMVSIDGKFSTIQTQLNAQATIQAVNSEKLKTLTKD